MAMKDHTTTRLLSPKDVASYLQVSLRTVRRLIKSEKIKFLRIRGSIRITQAALDAYLTKAASR
ncbi:MAG TPA: helix-turn-helix domain-containing protein [Nitrospiraceae bacterium]|nr:helix-turn-helix domain-containing protein [Nitrospiraceae bacterium]